MNALLLSVAPLLSSGDLAPSPAELRIEHTLDAIATQPARFQHYNALALGLARRARETADPEFYARAHGALDVSLALSPDNFVARRTRAWVFLGQHRFEEGLALAAELQRAVPDDLLLYGFLVDGHVELGNYAAAEEACQWMLDMRPGNVPALTRAAYLRELFGDLEGALDLMEQAYARVPDSAREDRAWILAQIAHLQRNAGRWDIELAVSEAALEIFPDYHYALAELGRARGELGDLDGAVAALRERHAVAPHPENRYDLAVALAAAGRTDEARAELATFEAEAILESEALDNANRELVAFYLDHADSADAGSEALSITTRERERRRDVHTRHLHARALLAAGRVAEAADEMEAVFEVGTRETGMLLTAARVELAAGAPEKARRHLEACVGARPASTDASVAREMLAGL